MAELVSFILSAFSQNVPTSNGSIVQQLTAPVIALRPKFVPSEYSFSVTVGISGFDLTKDNTIRFVFETPAGTNLVDTGSISLSGTPHDDTLPDEWQGIVVTLPIQNTQIETEGVYHLIVFFNEEQIDSKNIPVYRQSEKK